MAYTNEQVTSIIDLIDKLDTWMSSNGWTSEHKDLTSTAITGGEWAMRRTAGATNLRFAASWDGAGTATHIALYQYVDQAYVIGDRPWGQDHDSGNGYGASSPNANVPTHRHVTVTATPIQYWAFEDDDYTHIVVETTLGEYAHFGWGLGIKYGDWTGGEYCYGQRNSGTTGAAQANRDDRSHLLDGLFNDTVDVGGLSDDSELIAATVHCESLPNQTANGMWAVCMGGKSASPQTDFGFDRQSNDGVSTDTARELFTWGYRAGPMANGYYRIDGTDLSGHHAMWEVGLTYIDSGGDMYGTPILKMDGVRGMSIKNWNPADTFVVGGDTWMVFPAHTKYSGTGAETGTSGYLGIAYKQVS